MASASRPAPVDRAPLALLAAYGAIPEQGVELRFFPVHDLRREAASTFFCTPVFATGGMEVVHGYRAFREFGPRDLPALDCAILQQAVRFARRLEAAAIVAAVGTPVNFETLAWSKGRDLYVEALRESGAAQDHYLIVKIEDIPPGTPDSRLADAIAALRHHTRRVFVHLSDYDARFVHSSPLGAAGFVTSLAARATRPTIMAAAKSLVRMCDSQRALSCVDCVETETALDIVRAIGVRFGAGPVFGDEILRADAPIETVQRVMGFNDWGTPIRPPAAHFEPRPA